MIQTVVGGYKILEKIGTGGMGDVYKARDMILEREVALKSLRPELSDDPNLAKRFQAEAITLARLNHPNIVTLYNLFREDDQYYMVLELVHGETLDKLIKRCGAIPWRTAVPILCQALNGLEHAHILKVIHRDLKPSNLILTQIGTVKIMDFGIARILEESGLTRTGYMVGTIQYMSPEQVRGQKTDTRSDIYSIGVLLYQLLTGHAIFEGKNEYELLRLQVEECPVSPREFVPQLPKALEAVVMRALAKAPEERFQNAAEFRNALEIILKATSTGEEDRIYIPSIEPRLDSNVPPTLVQEPSATASASMPSDQTGRHFARYGSYLKNYRSITLLVALIGIIAVLFGGMLRSRHSSETASNLPLPLTGETIITAQPKSSSPVISVPAPGIEQAAITGMQSVSTVETTAVGSRKEQQSKPDQRSNQEQKPEADQQRQATENPVAVSSVERSPVTEQTSIPAPVATLTPPSPSSQSEKEEPSRIPPLTVPQKSKPDKKKNTTPLKRKAQQEEIAVEKRSTTSPQQHTKLSHSGLSADGKYSGGWKIRD
jgi:serine/threonine-protein kinase